MKIGIISQARMTSTRLPGKVLLQVKGKTLLEYHMARLYWSKLPVAIATTTNATDEPIVDYCLKNNIPFYRGSEANVLSRYYYTAAQQQWDVIVRVTSDCPLIDGHLIRAGVDKYVQLYKPGLYLSNGIERSFARGFDFEIFSFQALEQAFKSAKEASDLEHVTPYIWKNKAGNTTFYNFKQAVDNSNLRVTVDTDADFELINRLIENYHAEKLSYSEIEKILMEHPGLRALNAHIVQKEV